LFSEIEVIQRTTKLLRPFGGISLTKEKNFVPMQCGPLAGLDWFIFFTKTIHHQ
jgi:hypothetical protein